MWGSFASVGGKRPEPFRIHRLKSLQDEHAVRQYHALLQQLVELRAQLRALLNAPQASLPFLQPGAERRRGPRGTQFSVKIDVKP